MHALDLFKAKQFRIGLATSSPLSLAKIVTDKLDIGDYFDAVTSAGDLPFGKPHPQVYMDCASALSVSPLECLAFEDSFNGLIAAKAARMKCVVIPVADQYDLPKWGAADFRLSSLLDFSPKIIPTVKDGQALLFSRNAQAIAIMTRTNPMNNSKHIFEYIILPKAGNTNHSPTQIAKTPRHFKRKSALLSSLIVKEFKGAY